MPERPSKRWIERSIPQSRTFTPKRVDKNARVIRDPRRFAEYITKRDRELLDRLAEYDRDGEAYQSLRPLDQERLSPAANHGEFVILNEVKDLTSQN